jgi:hypothetical protein
MAEGNPPITQRGPGRKQDQENTIHEITRNGTKNIFVLVGVVSWIVSVSDELLRANRPKLKSETNARAELQIVFCLRR